MKSISALTLLLAMACGTPPAPQASNQYEGLPPEIAQLDSDDTERVGAASDALMARGIEAHEDILRATKGTNLRLRQRGKKLHGD